MVSVSVPQCRAVPNKGQGFEPDQKTPLEMTPRSEVKFLVAASGVASTDMAEEAEKREKEVELNAWIRRAFCVFG